MTTGGTDNAEKRLVDAVADAIQEKFPGVRVERSVARAYHGTLVTFWPPSAGASLTLYANYDWSFSLEWDRGMILDDVLMDESESDRITRVVAAIEEIARTGIPLPRSRLGRFLAGRHPGYGAWS